MFTDLLKDKNSSNQIQADSPQLRSYFYLLIDLSISLPNQYEAILNSQNPEFEEDDIMQMDQVKPNLFEQFLNEVFSTDHNLEMAEFQRHITH